MDEIRIDGAADLPCGEMLRIDVGDLPVCIARVADGAFFGLDDTCSHGQFSLSEGYLQGRQVECVMHGSLFDVSTGQPLTPPATQPVRTYQVKVDGEDLVLLMPDDQ